jgi:uracil-DNA glycosylase family 4
MDRCALCPAKHNVVPPSGPEDSDVLFIGEAPGKDEDRMGSPFIGKTGEEVNRHYLPLAGLRRESCHFDNSIRCLPDRPQGRLDIHRDADRELLLSCSSHGVLAGLERSLPRLIVPMGVLACYALDPDINLELQHGIPLMTSWGTVFPMYHPAGGIHEPKKMLMIRNDWVRLGKYLKGKLKRPVDLFPNPDYREITADELLDDYLACNDYTHPIACDTEVTRKREPFCLSYSTWPGTGRLIRAEDKDALEIFQCMLDRWEGPILFHNWGFDSQVVEKMGLRFPHKRIIDTMVRAYHLGNLPQGLKALAYRLLGMQMQDFDDLVTPYSTPLCLSYLREAVNHEWPKPEEQTVRDPQGQWKLYKPQSMSTKLKRFLTDYQKHPDKDVFQAWDNWEDDHKLIEMVCGEWPGKSIEHVPMDKTIHYACRDADATLRLWPVLQGMTRQVRRKLSEHWSD